MAHVEFEPLKIYTRVGDDGRTHLCYGPRVAKDDPRIEACGAVDELNAFLGLARAEALGEDLDQLLRAVQHQLFGVGADLATPGLTQQTSAHIDDGHVSRLEAAIDEYDAQVPALSEFILPGGSRAASLLHVARTVCRRAERRVVGIMHPEPAADGLLPIVRYLNRLSDLLFTLTRVVNSRAEIADQGWNKNS